MIYGVAVLGWWMAEISAVFLAAAVIVGVIARMGEETFTSTFIDGARDLPWCGTDYRHRPRYCGRDG